MMNRSIDSGPAIRASDEVVDLRKVGRAFWRVRWAFVLSAVTGLALGAQKIVDHQPVYEASMTIMPISSQFASGQPAASGGVAGLASLGLAFGTRTASNFERLRVVIGSLDFAESLEKKYGLVEKFFGQQRDIETGKWKRPTSQRFFDDQKLRAKLGLGLWAEPGIHSLAALLKGGFVIKEVNQGMFFRISVTHSDRDMALWMITTVFKEADNRLRDMDHKESTDRRLYLDQQLRAANIVELRTALAQLLTLEERQAMLLAGDLAYSARIVDPPSVSSQPLAQEILNTLLPFLIGSLLLSMVCVLFGLFMFSDSED